MALNSISKKKNQYLRSLEIHIYFNENKIALLLLLLNEEMETAAT